MKESQTDFKDRTLILTIIGIGLLFIGVAAFFLGPIEMYAFYLFSAGGRFHYEGFGFGSFMFANIAWQVIGYYGIALLLIPLGYGHMRLRRWARGMMLSLLWCWLILGLPLMIVFLFMLSVKDLSATASAFVVITLGISYLLVSGWLIRFYQSLDVQQTFEAKDQNSYWIETRPLPILTLTVLCTFYVVVLHVPLFLNGIFPVFGAWLSGIEGIYALATCIVCLAWLTWGVARQRLWAWWGSAVYFTALTLSTIITLVQSSFSEMVLLMRLPPRELEFLKGVPLQGAHFALFFGIPLIGALALIITARRYFGAEQKKRKESE